MKRKLFFFVTALVASVNVSAATKSDTIPVTVAEAVAVASALNEGATSMDVYAITGYVDSIHQTYSPQYKNISFFMCDDMSNPTYDFLAYRVKGGETLTVGDKVVVIGRLFNYKGFCETARYPFMEIIPLMFLRLSIENNCNDMGEVYGGGVYFPDEKVTFSATPNYGYHFVCWSDGNTDNPRTIMLSQDTTLIARFAPNKYVVTINNDNPDCGIVNGGTTADYLSDVVLSATPNFGYHFVCWSDGNTDNPRTITLTQDTTLTATFAKDYSGKCGDDLYWQYKDTELKISGTGVMYHYMEATQPWQLFRDSIRAVYTDNTTTSIGEYAFANTKRLSKLHIGAKVEDIGAYAFADCSRLYDIYCYAAEPPFAETNSFAYYQAYVRIPCESQRDYTMDLVWRQFENIQCLGSEEVVLPSNKVTVTPTETDATFTWPTNDKAESYSLVITKDGVVFCTLLFNSKGQLTGIAFAPARDRDNVHTTPAAKALVNGWQFTVTGLNEKSDYAYTLTVTDKSDKVLKSYEGTFSTLGEDLPDGLTTPTESAASAQKIIRDGQVLIQRGDKVYTLTGQEVVNH
ncbi:MAG: leucine-rich repeat protein [Paludibacteraceae bacterium]